MRGIHAAGEPEPLAVLLGAPSLADAQTSLDALERAADQNSAVGRQAGRARVSVGGTAVAADVGPAVRGLVIDLWFPTLAEARAWGRRTVTITLL